jgi:single-strand DNA-binding protein
MKMSGVNKAIILGRVGRDPEMKFTQSGAAVCNFSVATSENWIDKLSGEKKEKTE